MSKLSKFYFTCMYLYMILMLLLNIFRFSDYRVTLLGVVLWALCIVKYILSNRLHSATMPFYYANRRVLDNISWHFSIQTKRKRVDMLIFILILLQIISLIVLGVLLYVYFSDILFVQIYR